MAIRLAFHSEQLIELSDGSEESEFVASQFEFACNNTDSDKQASSPMQSNLNSASPMADMTNMLHNQSIHTHQSNQTNQDNQTQFPSFLTNNHNVYLHQPRPSIHRAMSQQHQMNPNEQQLSQTHQTASQEHPILEPGSLNLSGSKHDQLLLETCDRPRHFFGYQQPSQLPRSDLQSQQERDRLFSVLIRNPKIKGKSLNYRIWSEREREREQI